MLSQAVIAFLDSRRDKHVRQLIELLRFPSISADPAREGDCLDCARWLADRLAAMGFDAQLLPWRSHPVLVARRNCQRPGAATVILYGHYDVQPADPLELWESPPFEPAVREGAVYARGASDDKGQLLANIHAVEALLHTDGGLPANVLFLLEGEEEIGSPEFESFLTAHADLLRADHAVITDAEFFAPGVPAITTGLRGLAYFEITVTGPGRDLHSGLYGGAAVNPLNALAAIVAGMRDEAGRVTLPGFYDDVVEPAEAERQAWARLPFDEAAFEAGMGAPAAGGERGLPLLDRLWARPTLDCHGITGGYQGPGAKTVIPSAATAKVSMRLVPDQRPEQVAEGLRQYLIAHTPAGVRAEATCLTAARPVLIPPDSPAISAASAGLTEAFGAAPAFVRMGASVPITELIQRILGIDPIVTGYALPDDNLHSPNEHFQLAQFHRGAVATAAMLSRLGGGEG
ncbi:MAG TPA: dipeptidase [Phycisphaerae bacterium]|nr:dipeptidase [Phycisphaerae bacterium]